MSVEVAAHALPVLLADGRVDALDAALGLGEHLLLEVDLLGRPPPCTYRPRRRSVHRVGRVRRRGLVRAVSIAPSDIVPPLPKKPKKENLGESSPMRNPGRLRAERADGGHEALAKLPQRLRRGLRARRQRARPRRRRGPERCGPSAGGARPRRVRGRSRGARGAPLSRAFSARGARPAPPTRARAAITARV